MSYEFELTEDLAKTLEKLSKKDKDLALAVNKKIKQIISLDEAGIMHFKNLTGALKSSKRVHVGSFVLLFRVKGQKIIFESLEHHDRAYHN